MLMALCGFCQVMSSAHSASMAGTAPPFAFSLDQSIPCPAAAQDYSIADLPGVDVNVSSAAGDMLQLQQALARTPSMLDVKLSQLGCPSASVIVTQGGRIIYRSFRGSARMHSAAPLLDDTGYKIASLTKTFTVAMLFILRDEGKLPQGLDTPVTALLPSFSIRSRFPSRRAITLRSLAMHASGLPREVPDGATEAEILRAVSQMEVLCPMYAQTHYSNFGIALLGRALERASGGLSWEAFVASRILAPLGMNDSGNPPWPTPAARARMAEGARRWAVFLVSCALRPWRLARALARGHMQGREGGRATLDDSLAACAGCRCRMLGADAVPGAGCWVAVRQPGGGGAAAQRHGLGLAVRQHVLLAAGYGHLDELLDGRGHAVAEAALGVRAGPGDADGDAPHRHRAAGARAAPCCCPPAAAAAPLAAGRLGGWGTVPYVASVLARPCVRRGRGRRQPTSWLVGGAGRGLAYRTRSPAWRAASSRRPSCTGVAPPTSSAATAATARTSPWCPTWPSASSPSRPPPATCASGVPIVYAVRFG